MESDGQATQVLFEEMVPSGQVEHTLPLAISRGPQARHCPSFVDPSATEMDAAGQTLHVPASSRRLASGGAPMMSWIDESRQAFQRACAGADGETPLCS